MKCRQVRERLTSAGGAGAGAEVGPHLETCSSCARFARRLEVYFELVAGRRAVFEPGPDFAPRVLASLPGAPDLLGWAALRFMPAAVALALVLTGWSLLAAPSPTALIEQSATDDPLTWVTEMEVGE